MGNFYNASFENGLGYWWSIALEVQFYFFLPILLFLSGKYFWKVITSLLVISLFSELWISYPKFWMFRGHSLFSGLIAWKVSTMPSFQLIKCKISELSTFHISTIIAFIMFFMLLVAKRLWLFQFPVAFFIGCLTAGCLLLSISTQRVIFGRYISFVLVFLGKISYSLYLCHLIVFIIGLKVLEKLHLLGSGWSLSLYVAAILVAYGSMKYIEPMMKREKYMA